MGRTEQNIRDDYCVYLYWTPEWRGYRSGRKNSPRRFLLLTRKRKESCGNGLKTCKGCPGVFRERRSGATFLGRVWL